MQETPVRFLGQEDPLEKGQETHQYSWASLVGLAGKESSCNARDLGWEDPLEKGKATHSSILAWRIPWTVQLAQTVKRSACSVGDPGSRAAVHGVAKSRTRLSDFTHSLYSSKGYKESDMAEQLSHIELQQI